MSDSAKLQALLGMAEVNELLSSKIPTQYITITEENGKTYYEEYDSGKFFKEQIKGCDELRPYEKTIISLASTKCL